MKKLNITFCSFPDFSSNAKPLYEFMKKKYNDKMDFTWIVRTDEMVGVLKEKNINVIKLYSDDYYNYMKKSDIIFTTHADLINEKNNNTLYIELWHGISSKHIANLSDNINDFDKDFYKTVKKRIDYFIVPSDFWRVIFATRFNVNYNRILSLGYPKLDYFVQNNPKDRLEKVLNLNINNYNKIIYYMPTFRKSCFRQSDSEVNTNNIFNLENYDEKLLQDYLQKNKYLLCIKKHPSEEIDFNYIENDNIKIITDEMLLMNNITINDIMNAGDLMITDYSSLGIEFIFLEKPVIYLVKDIEEYRIRRGITFNNSDFWMPGYRVKNISELLDSIDNSFKKNYKYKNDMLEKKKLWFGNLNDGGCNRICNFIFDEEGKINKSVQYYVDYEEELENKILSLENTIDMKDYIINEKDKELNIIKSSRGWKILEKLRKIKRKIFGK